MFLLSDVVIAGNLKGVDGSSQYYVLILGKSYLFSCRRKDIKPSVSHFGRILENKYETEKYIAFKSNSYPRGGDSHMEHTGMLVGNFVNP